MAIQESQRLLLIDGPGFEHAIGEMDKIAICVTDASASGHVMRTQVVVAVAVSYVRENPEIEEETIDMDPREWAMGAFILSYGLLHPEEGFGTGSAIAAMWGLQSGCSNHLINRASEWAFKQIARR
jgi:hypothetical protein